MTAKLLIYLKVEREIRIKIVQRALHPPEAAFEPITVNANTRVEYINGSTIAGKLNVSGRASLL